MAVSNAVPQQPAAATKRAAVSPPRVNVPPVAVAQPRNGDRLLDALKEELFQLEMERHQGKISADEYEKAKTALDTTLARAAKRASS